ncbi:MAG TPA: class I SAM-dependent methyltransferase [Pyrinomonadaceae bacterium]|nr:class I SAM-dependent methyltransferase [Pyrinomonadaceae bacterium]
MAVNSDKQCPACLGNQKTEVGNKNNFILQRCHDCQTIFAKVAFEAEETAEEVKELYDHYYDFANFKLHPAAEISLQKIVESFAAFKQTGNLVDIGFGEGGLLSIAEKNGWKCFGTELSPQSLKYGTERGWTVSNDAFSDKRFPQNGFDVVTMVELIEHVPNPDFFLETASKLLRPNGLLFMTTPNTQSLNRRWLGAEWSVISPPEHITIWSPGGMRKALKRNGFITQKIRTEGFNPIEILNSFRTKTNETEVPVHRNEAGFALNEAFTSSPWRRAVKSTINQGLSLFKLGDGIKIWAVKKT